ncbi:MAG: phosphatidate cytidylyltransferase [Aureliella sp.]
MTRGLVAVLVVVFCVLSLGSLVRICGLRREATLGGEQTSFVQQRTDSLRQWWWLLIAFSLALLFGKFGLAVLFCAATLIGLYEFHTIFAQRSADSAWPSLLVGFLALVHYSLVASVASSWTLPGMASLLFFSLILQQIIGGGTRDYLRTTAGYFWASLLLVIGLSHAVLLCDLPVSSNPWNAGVVGWTIYLVLLTESNDIAQALIGRRFGKRKVIPSISPGKSWVGLLGGVLVTALLAICLAPPLTTFLQSRPLGQGLAIAVLSGVLISIAGFLGDLNISALKREVHVKDSSHLFPGMGGMLDRLDSLTLAAPAFFYLARAVG